MYPGGRAHPGRLALLRCVVGTVPGSRGGRGLCLGATLSSPSPSPPLYGEGNAAVNLVRRSPVEEPGTQRQVLSGAVTRGHWPPQPMAGDSLRLNQCPGLPSTHSRVAQPLARPSFTPSQPLAMVTRVRTSPSVGTVTLIWGSSGTGVAASGSPQNRADPMRW